MIRRECYVHSVTDDNLFFPHNGFFSDGTDRENCSFRRIDNSNKIFYAEHPQVGDRKRALRQIGLGERARQGLIAQPLRRGA